MHVVKLSENEIGAISIVGKSAGERVRSAETSFCGPGGKGTPQIPAVVSWEDRERRSRLHPGVLGS